jgi:predicted GNAT family acetyltransferase
MVAIIASFWNGNLIVQAPTFLEPLVNIVVRESGRPIRGVIGPEEQVSVVKNLLDLDESVIQRDETDILFSLDMAKLVVPENLRSGKVRGRLIEEKDIDQLAHWMTAYMAEALGEQPGPELERKSKSDVERAFEEKRTWVLEEDGQLVAMSSFNTSIREAVQVGGVWTPPELRRNGYGRAVVATSLLDAAREGVSKSILFTAHDNIAAQRAYLAIGFQQTGHYRLLLLNQGVIIK